MKSKIQLVTTTIAVLTLFALIVTPNVRCADWTTLISEKTIECTVSDIKTNWLGQWTGLNVTYSAKGGQLPDITYECKHDSPDWGFTCNIKSYHYRECATYDIKVGICGPTTRYMHLYPGKATQSEVCQKLGDSGYIHECNIGWSVCKGWQ